MTVGIAGDYVLRMKLGNNDLPLAFSAMHDFSIIQDFNRLLPYYQFQAADASGLLTHIAPFDKNVTKLSCEIGTSDVSNIRNAFTFKTYRRFPEMINAAATNFDSQGLLDIPNLFNPSRCRAMQGTIYDALASIAVNELLIDKLDISNQLQVDRTLIQPNWSNAELFKYLKRTLGDNGGYSYYPYIYVKDSQYVFAMKSLEDMCSQDPVYKFIVNDEPYQDYLPVLDYAIFDNYNVLGIKGIKTQQFGYFDWHNSQWVESIDSYQDFLSLSDYISYDYEDQADSEPIYDTGRTNDFTRTFLGRERGEYYRRINSLVKMWIQTPAGLPNLVPGEVVKVLFADGLSSGDLATYQYSGYWLVERVCHSFGKTFFTKMLLTRAGIDTDQYTSAMRPLRRKL